MTLRRIELSKFCSNHILLQRNEHYYKEISYAAWKAAMLPGNEQCYLKINNATEYQQYYLEISNTTLKSVCTTWISEIIPENQHGYLDISNATLKSAIIPGNQ